MRQQTDNTQPVAIVTGGSKGIGAGVVEMLLGRGYRVIASYGHDEAAADKMRQRGAEMIKADHTHRPDTYAFIEYIRSQANSISCVVCNAGVTIRHSFLETTDRDWDAMHEVAVNAHFILLRELKPLMAHGGRIIFTGSTVVRYPHATVLGYGVSKAGVHALVQNLVKEFAEQEVTVNGVVPGFVDTEWQKLKPEQIRNNICHKTAIHRFATVEETVKAYEFCLDNGFVNGSLIEVNGGYSYR